MEFRVTRRCSRVFDQPESDAAQRDQPLATALRTGVFDRIARAGRGWRGHSMSKRNGGDAPLTVVDAISVRFCRYSMNTLSLMSSRDPARRATIYPARLHRHGGVRVLAACKRRHRRRRSSRRWRCRDGRGKRTGRRASYDEIELGAQAPCGRQRAATTRCRSPRVERAFALDGEPFARHPRRHERCHAVVAMSLSRQASSLGLQDAEKKKKKTKIRHGRSVTAGRTVGARATLLRQRRNGAAG